MTGRLTLLMAVSLCLSATHSGLPKTVADPVFAGPQALVDDPVFVDGRRADPGATRVPHALRGRVAAAVTHPAGRWAYIADRELDRGRGQVHIVDLQAADGPRTTATVALGAGIASSSLALDPDGRHLYAATGTHTAVLDLAKPGRPVMVGRIYDYMVRNHSEVAVTDVSDDVLGDRRFLTVRSRLGGSAACPTGTVHVYDITGGLRQRPVMVADSDVPSDAAASANRAGNCPTLAVAVDGAGRQLRVEWLNAGQTRRSDRYPYDITALFQDGADRCLLVPL